MQAVDHVVRATRAGKVVHQLVFGHPVVETQRSAGYLAKPRKGAEEPSPDPTFNLRERHTLQ
jgi:3-deoxy-D-arabino-heptulosonate 7-phosphate (DAHP) synthase class II